MPAPQLSSESEKAIAALLPLYPQARAALIPALFIVQKELGNIPDWSQARVAELLALPAPQVQEVVSFYPMFAKTKRGSCHLQVCRTLSCAMRGGRTLIHKIEEELKIHAGETTPDGKFSLQEMECLASCGTAPAMLVNERFEENLDWAKVKTIIDRVRQGGEP
jgi:NADH-quinone oxidoreductase subunit E